MVYSKHEWQSGELITSAKLNNIENGIYHSTLYNNVKEFGATGDGATDDSSAFQKAIDAAYANFANLANKETITGSFEVDIPSGVYEISSTLVLPPMVKLKAIGFVQLKYNGKSGTSCIWVKQKMMFQNIQIV